MTYKRLVKEIDDHTKGKEGATLIDGLILRYGKVTTMDALYYVAEFWKSAMMMRMDYWYDRRHASDLNLHPCTCEIMQAMARLYPQYTTECEYFINA
jgi:hypothetical protein